MPIDKDGNIIAVSQWGDRYVTRVVLEFKYAEGGYAKAQQIHEALIEAVADGAGQIDAALGFPVHTNIGYAKNPAALPEGEGEDGVQP